jgi:hypothetical protein
MWTLWLAAFAGPGAWTAHNLLSAALVSAACASVFGVLALHSLTVVTFGASVAGAAVGYRLRALEPGGARFVALGSAMLGTLFALVILAEGLPTLILSPCWP